MGGPGTPPVISASELERYAYCPLSWWLERQGQEAEGEAVRAGEEVHRQAGEALVGIRRDEAAARESEVSVLWLAVVATLLSLVGVTLLPLSYSEVFGRMLGLVALIWLLAASFFLYRSESLPVREERTKYEAVIMVFAMVATVFAIISVPMALVTNAQSARFLEIAALVWLIGASVFFYHSLRKRRDAARVKREQRMRQESEVKYVDTLKKADADRALFSARFGLRGRPDAILVEDGKHVPVELKAGRTPRGPLFSHILQLGAYMLLVEETYGAPPPAGVLKYSEREERIEWTSELKMLVVFKLDEMREKLNSGAVHRNHNRPGKCRNCSRRNGCPERLD